MEKLSLPEKDLTCKISFLHQMSVSETYHLHTHDFYEIFYVVKGRAMHSINGLTECCMAGTAQLIRPTDYHEYQFINRYDMELISIGIAVEVMEEILAFAEVSMETVCAGDLPLRVVYDARKSERIQKALLKIGTMDSPKKRRAYAKTVMAQLLWDMVESQSETRKMPFWLDRLIGEMNEYESFYQGLPRMLALSCVSQNHLNREMKKYLGMTPTEFINAKRIAYASSLLLENKYSITEISGRCGFETSSHFYENFRKIYDCSPKEFLKTHRER